MLDKSKLHLEASVDKEGHRIQRWHHNENLVAPQQSHGMLSIGDLLERRKVKAEEKKEPEEKEMPMEEVIAGIERKLGHRLKDDSPEGWKYSQATHEAIKYIDSLRAGDKSSYARSYYLWVRGGEKSVDVPPPNVPMQLPKAYASEVRKRLDAIFEPTGKHPGMMRKPEEKELEKESSRSITEHTTPETPKDTENITRDERIGIENLLKKQFPDHKDWIDDFMEMASKHRIKYYSPQYQTVGEHRERPTIKERAEHWTNAARRYISVLDAAKKSGISFAPEKTFDWAVSGKSLKETFGITRDIPAIEPKKELFDRDEALKSISRKGYHDAFSPIGRKASFKVIPSSSYSEQEPSYMVEQTTTGQRILHNHPSGSHFKSLEEAQSGAVGIAKEFSESKHHLPTIYSDLDEKGRHEFMDRDGKRHVMEIKDTGLDPYSDHYGTFLDGVHQNDDFSARYKAVRSGMLDVESMGNPETKGTFEEQFNTAKEMSKKNNPNDRNSEHTSKALYTTLRKHGIKDIDEFYIHDQVGRFGVRREDISAKDIIKQITESMTHVPEQQQYHKSVSEAHGLNYPQRWGSYKPPVSADLNKYEQEIKDAAKRNKARFGSPKYAEMVKNFAWKIGEVIQKNGHSQRNVSVEERKAEHREIANVSDQAIGKANDLRDSVKKIKKLHDLVGLDHPTERLAKMKDRADMLEKEAKDKNAYVEKQVKDLEEAIPFELAQEYVIDISHPENHKHLRAVWDEYKRQAGK